MSTSRIDAHLEQVRTRLRRVDPGTLRSEIDAGALVIDIRPEKDRRREGHMPGAIVVERNEVEWRLDPTSDHCLDEPIGGRRVILVCNEGYASSLAAASLLDLGVAGATDLVGGYRAWVASARLDG